MRLYNYDVQFTWKNMEWCTLVNNSIIVCSNLANVYRLFRNNTLPRVNNCDTPFYNPCAHYIASAYTIISTTLCLHGIQSGYPFYIISLKTFTFIHTSIKRCNGSTVTHFFFYIIPIHFDIMIYSGVVM